MSEEAEIKLFPSEFTGQRETKRTASVCKEYLRLVGVTTMLRISANYNFDKRQFLKFSFDPNFVSNNDS